MSKIAKIQLYAVIFFVTGVILFILLAFGSEMLNDRASGVFDAEMKDGTPIQVIILTDVPYSEKHWNRIKRITKSEASKDNDVLDISSNIYNILENGGTSVITVTGSKKIYKVYQ